MVKTVDDEIERTIKLYSGDYESMDEQIKNGVVRLLRLRQSFLLATPQKAINLAHFERSGDKVSMDKIDRDVEALIKSLPYASKDSMEQFVHDIRMNSILASSEKANGMAKFRAQRYFYGLYGRFDIALTVQRTTRYGKDVFRDPAR